MGWRRCFSDFFSFYSLELFLAIIERGSRVVCFEVVAREILKVG